MGLDNHSSSLITVGCRVKALLEKLLDLYSCRTIDFLEGNTRLTVESMSVVVAGMGGASLVGVG